MNAEKRAKDNQLKPVRPYQYHEAEIDPAPHMPLDNVIWGNPATNFVPMSSYNCTYMDPKVIEERRKQMVEAYRNG